MNITTDNSSTTDDIVIHKVGKQAYQYKKIFDENNCTSYERLMSEEERKLTNQQIVFKIIKQLN